MRAIITLILLLIASMNISHAETKFDYREFVITYSDFMIVDELDVLGKKIVNRKNRDQLMLHCLERIEGKCAKAGIVVMIQQFGTKKHYLVRGQNNKVRVLNLMKQSVEEQNFNRNIANISVLDGYNHNLLTFTKNAIEEVGDTPIIGVLVPFAVVTDIILSPADLFVGITRTFGKVSRRFQKKKIIKAFTNKANKDQKVFGKFFSKLVLSLK